MSAGLTGRAVETKVPIPTRWIDVPDTFGILKQAEFKIFSIKY